MGKEEIRVSSEIDAWCTKCRLVTNHRVVAIVAGVVKRVICLTCDGQHNFRPPPGIKRTKPVKARRVTADRKKDRSRPSEPFAWWQEMKDALDPDISVRPYLMAAAFEASEALEHARFGLGFVTRKVGVNKIEVMFEKEIKVLIAKR